MMIQTLMYGMLWVIVVKHDYNDHEAILIDDGHCPVDSASWKITGCSWLDHRSHGSRWRRFAHGDAA